ncbi:protein SCAF11 isoform X2 [Mixophyes fleayi]|uniref:protein SCAF11 isoform X2 n=1 Tax=Mixophyes fleayi TaxID=3061075 RepID=UPI003F4DE195
MRNKCLCSFGAGGEQHEEKDGEENENSSCASAVGLNASERCPICLNILTLEVGFPEDCCHAFCVSCILKWSETSNSCPVDRKPFQAVYKIDQVGGCTKIQVMERRPRDNCYCSCNQRLSCCTKCKINFRMYVNPESMSESIDLRKKNRCINNEEKSELELKILSRQNLAYTDVMATSPFDLSEITQCVNSAGVEEESEMCLIQRKREGLKHLRFPTAVERIECNSLSAEILIQPPPSLDDYIFTRSPFSIRNKDFSKRTCVHSSTQEGTEKKQTASGASNSRGTRKKPVQSSTRRRSTRNSKSDASQLQSSPKSSSSDHDTLGCNTSSTKASENTSKQPSKQRKRAPKKASQVRKRLRSATHTQEDSNESKENSESESEQEEKKMKMPEEDLSATEQCETSVAPTKSTEKGYQHVDDHSLDSSPLEHCDEQKLSVSLPMQMMQCVDKEISTSLDLQSRHQFDGEHIPTSPVFKNGQSSLGESQPASPAHVMQHESGNEEIAKEQFCLEEQPTLVPGNVSEGEDSSSSQVSAKHIDSDNTDLSPLSSGRVQQFHDKESACSPTSKKELMSKHSVSSASSEDIQDANEQDSQFKNGQHFPCSPALEDALQDGKSRKAEESIVSVAVYSDKQCDLELSKLCPDSFKEHQSETQAIVELQNMEPTVPDCSLKPDHGLDEQANGLEVSLQSTNLNEECIEERDIKTCIPCESDHKHSPNTSVSRTELPEEALTKNSASDGSCDVNETNRLCSDDIQNPFLENMLKSLSEPSSDVEGGKIPVTDNGKTPDVKNEPQKTFCEDNIESVAMDCDSVCSDHNESEIEQTAENIVTTRTESDPLVSTNREVLQSPPKELLPLGSDAPKKESRARKSRFHSPSKTWSPTKSDVKERQRSRSRSKIRDSPVKRKSRSRDRDGDRNHGGQWKERSRDRRHRMQSRSRSRSRSRSGSRTRNRHRSNTTDRSEKDCSSPPWKERRSNDNWKSPRGSERYRRNEHEKTNEHFRNEKYDARDTAEQHPENKNDYPDWVLEKIKSGESRGRGDAWMRGDGRGRGDRGWGDTRNKGDSRGRGDNRGDFRGRGDRGRGNRGRGSPRGGSWEDNQYSSGDSWSRNVNMDWNLPRGNGGRGRGGFRGGFSYGDQNENTWNNRQSYSGNSNTSGQESSRFPEHKNYKPKYEDSFEPPADRSGWSSASSWAVRKTLPADVQNYYSKRGRNSTGSQPVWPRQEESQDQDQALKDQPSQQNESAPVPVNMVQTQMNVVQQPMNAPPQPMNIFPYPVGVHPPIVNIQHNPYNLHQQLPIHLHPALPLVQVSAPSSVPQGLPPPPPPPPPSQQVNYIAPQQDGKPVQKIQIQERAAHEVKVAIKPYYQNKDITKEEYKEIVKKAVDKVCHSKSGEVDSAKVANLVKAYVDKYKHNRKKGTEDKL